MKLLISLLSIISYFSVFAQNETLAYNYFSDQGVEINVTEESCNDIKYGIEKQLLIIELKNNNSYPVKVSFHKDSWYDNKCTSCNSNSNEFNVEEILLPNSSIKGNCFQEKKYLTIFKKMLNLEKVKQLSKYEFKKITVEKVIQ